MSRIFALLAFIALLAGCTGYTPQDPLVPLGEFNLNYTYVYAAKARKGPVSRTASEEEWVAALTSAIDERLGQYQGSQGYDIGVSVEGYLLAPKGIPVLYSPKSALIINVTVVDLATNQKLNDKARQFTVFETTTQGSFLIGSGRERTKEQQMQGLSRNAVRNIEEWLAEQALNEGWFARQPDNEVSPEPSVQG